MECGSGSAHRNGHREDRKVGVELAPLLPLGRHRRRARRLAARWGELGRTCQRCIRRGESRARLRVTSGLVIELQVIWRLELARALRLRLPAMLTPRGAGQGAAELRAAVQRPLPGMTLQVATGRKVI